MIKTFQIDTFLIFNYKYLKKCFCIDIKNLSFGRVDGK